MPFAEIGDVKIHYRWDGPESAPVVMLSNSLGTDFSMWDAQVAAWSKTFRVLRYDTRGHGQSAVTPGPYTIQQLGCDVVALLDELAVDKVAFCGLSMGGQIGMWLGGNAPQRLHKLVLCNTGAKIGNTEGWNARIQSVRDGGMKSLAPAVIKRWFTEDFQAREAAKVAAVQAVLENTSLDGYIANCEAVRDFDYRERVDKIALPTLVVAGSADTATTPEDGRFIAERIVGARYLELNAAHLSNVGDEARFTSEVGAFLAA